MRHCSCKFNTFAADAHLLMHRQGAAGPKSPCCALPSVQPRPQIRLKSALKAKSLSAAPLVELCTRPLALDIEYVHFRSGDKVPAEICLLDSWKQVALYTHVKPDQPWSRADYKGGVPWGQLKTAPTLQQVLPDLQRVLQGAFQSHSLHT